MKDLNFLVVKYLHLYSVPSDLFPALFNLQVIYLDNVDHSPHPCHYSIPLHLVLLSLPLIVLQMSRLVVSNLLITMLLNLLQTIRKCLGMVAQYHSCQRQQQSMKRAVTHFLEFNGRQMQPKSHHDAILLDFLSFLQDSPPQNHYPKRFVLIYHLLQRLPHVIFHLQLLNSYLLNALLRILSPTLIILSGAPLLLNYPHPLLA